MKTSFTYLANGFVFEHVVDGDNVSYNLLPDVTPPAEPLPNDPPVPEPPQSGQVPVVPPLADLCAAPPPTKKKRTLMGTIRAAWFVLFTIAGEALTYALNNLTSLHLPPGTATAIGAVGYGVKRAVWPNSSL